MNKILFALALAAFILLSGCISQEIAEVKNDANVGEKVTVSGTVTNSIKIGDLSGYIIEDATGSLAVSSERLPAVGDKVTVTGTLVKDTIFGFYLDAK
ncbi:MAG: hypothetical protein NUV67_02065 [archaeon]|nr:hypothetical protein [archaeon]